jgi:PAS domain S-box-containing protein
LSDKLDSSLIEDILDSISDAFVSIDHKFRVTYINKAAEKFSGQKREDMVGKDILEAFPRGKNTILDEKYLKLFKENKSFEFETYFNNPPFNNWYNIRVFPSKRGFNMIFHDVNQLKKAENASKEREHRWSNLILNLPGMVYRCRNDENWTMEFISHQCKEITGYEPSDFINNAKIAYNDVILKDDQDHVSNTIQNCLSKNEPYEINYRIVTDQNEIKWVWERGLGVEDENGELFLEGFIEDITKLRNAEDEIKASLKEKNVLLKEIHHRVKNNMQIISSLLNLQKQYVEEEEAVDVLKESQNRVKSMAIIHEKLYLSKDLTSINFKGYIESLVSNLFYSYNIKSSQIKPVLDIENIKLNMETAVPCGLIISEIVSNSLKYAFPNRMKGKIHVSLKPEEDEYELIISDNGIGLPEGLDFNKLDSLGLLLVTNLTEQIDGEININRSHGTLFKINFKELKYKKRI